MRTISLQIVLLLAVILRTSPVLGDDSAESLAQLASCAQTVHDAQSRYRTILLTWFGESRKLGVIANFEAIAAKNRGFFQKIQTNLASFTPGEQNLEALQTQLVKLDSSHEQIIAEQQILANQEDLLIASLPPLDDGLAEVEAEFVTARNLCPPDASEPLSEALASIGPIRERLASLGSYAAHAAYKRSLLFRAALSSKRIRLINAFAQRTGQRVEELQSTAEQYLLADALHRRLQSWWEKVFVKQGPALGLSSRKLSYFAALRELGTEAETLTSFEAESQDLTGLSQTVRDNLLNQIRHKRSQVEAERDRLLTLGWKKLLESQRAKTTARNSRISAFATGCKSSLDLWESLVGTAEDPDTFRKFEHIYAIQLEACTRREGDQ